jgi:hypothetical protein
MKPVKEPTTNDLGGYLVKDELRIWWNHPRYGGLPIGAQLVRTGHLNIATVDDGRLTTDVAVFLHDDKYYTVDIWSDHIIRIHTEAPTVHIEQQEREGEL